MIDDRLRLAHQSANPQVVRLWLALTRLRSCASFMNTGAHPDDETSGMLACLSRRQGMRIAIAHATRGEGGQNAIGTERGADLGMLRTREMERAAEVLDAVLYWHSTGPDDPITDFGFSKSGEDTLRRWGHDATLERMVRIIREEKPDIICPTFLDVPGQHGHHQAMTRIAIEAFDAAADPTLWPAHADLGLAPWAALKLYLPAWSGAGESYDDDRPPPPATVSVDASGVDPVTGATYAQIGEWSRRFHLSQGMGRWVLGHDTRYPLHLLKSRTGHQCPEDSILSGLPSTLQLLAEQLGPARNLLTRAGESCDAAIAAWPHAANVAEHAAAALPALRDALATLDTSERALHGHRLQRKEREISAVLAIATGMDAHVTLDEPVSRRHFVIKADVFAPCTLTDVDFRVPDWAEQITVLHPPFGGTYRAKDGSPFSEGYPTRFDGQGLTGELGVKIRFAYAGLTIDHFVPAPERLSILPNVTVAVEPDVVVRNLANGTSSSPHVHVSLEPLWPHFGAEITLGTERQVIVPPQPKLATLMFSPVVPRHSGVTILPVTIDDQIAFASVRSDQAHAGPLARVVPATVKLFSVDVALPPGARIGVIGGGNDRIGVWLRRIGLDVTLLEPGQLNVDEWARFTTLVVGIFAFGTRPDLAEALPAIHAWVRAGGHLLTLYHRPGDNWDPARTPLAPITIGRPSLRWRVTDPAAPVTMLAPNHPLLAGPNPITPDDWSGWSKERGLYFASGWDAAYEPLLAMSDEGETPLAGSLLSGRFGRGRHTHTGLVLHTQAEALVPGAFRLLANLVAPVS